tara:strand:+ start:620 stop:1153 length:534 start_codon:yes stop_codon:yes gene_type:complete
MTHNNIYFRESFIKNKLKPIIPIDYVNFWGVDFNTKVGIIRIDRKEINTIYLFTPLRNYKEGVVRFDKNNLIWGFHSLYTDYDFTFKNKYSEYRYNLEMELLSTYKFLGTKDKKYPFHQYQNDKLTKKYKFEEAINPPIELEIAIDEGILSKFNVKSIKMDKLSIKGNPNSNYYYIR